MFVPSWMKFLSHASLSAEKIWAWRRWGRMSWSCLTSSDIQTFDLLRKALWDFLLIRGRVVSKTIGAIVKVLMIPSVDRVRVLQRSFLHVTVRTTMESWSSFQRVWATKGILWRSRERSPSNSFSESSSAAYVTCVTWMSAFRFFGLLSVTLASLASNSLNGVLIITWLGSAHWLHRVSSFSLSGFLRDFALLAS